MSRSRKRSAASAEQRQSAERKTVARETTQRERTQTVTAQGAADALDESTPQVRPPRKRPWFLLLSAVAVLLWIAFLLTMAFWR